MSKIRINIKNGPFFVLGTWRITTGDPTMIVGVLDTGVALSHPDLAANIWTNLLKELTVAIVIVTVMLMTSKAITFIMIIIMLMMTTTMARMWLAQLPQFVTMDAALLA